MINLPVFSIDSYDHEGDAYEDGIYLHFGETRIRIGETMEDYKKFCDHVTGMESEIRTALDND